MGRSKIKLTDEQRALIPGLAAILTQEQIAEYFGITAKTFMRICEDDLSIFTDYKKGKAAAIARAGQSLLNAVKNGNLTAIIFYLKTQGHWKEVQGIEHSGKIDEPIPNINLTSLTDEEKEILLRIVTKI